MSYPIIFVAAKTKLSHAEIIRRVQRSTNVIFQLILASWIINTFIIYI